MKQTVDIFITVKRNALVILGLCLCVYFSYHIVSGKYGYARLNNLEPIAQTKEKQLEALKAKSDSLNIKVSMLRPETLSVDLLEEQARMIIGYTHKDEMIILDK